MYMADNNQIAFTDWYMVIVSTKDDSIEMPVPKFLKALEKKYKSDKFNVLYNEDTKKNEVVVKVDPETGLVKYVSYEEAWYLIVNSLHNVESYDDILKYSQFSTIIFSFSPPNARASLKYTSDFQKPVSSALLMIVYHGNSD